MKKLSISDLAPATAEQRADGQLAFSESIVKMRDDFERMKASPQWRAMDKMEAALKALRADPDINVSEPCRDLLDMMVELLDKAWPHHPIEDIVQPLQKHFDHVKSVDAVTAKNAKDPKQEAKEIVRQQWKIWQNNPADYKNKTDFALDMQAQFPMLKSKDGVSITRWCVKWEREQSKP